MRLCNKCGEIMKYNEVERKWECSCGNEIEAVTVHGDRVEKTIYGDVVGTW